MGNRSMDLSSYVYGQSDFCAPVCPLGVCDSPEDATKPECADCVACYARGDTNDPEYKPTFLNDAQVAAAQAAIARGDVSSIKVHSDLEMNVQAELNVPDYAYSSTEITWLQLSTGELKTFNFNASKCDYLSLTFSPARPEKLACETVKPSGRRRTSEGTMDCFPQPDGFAISEEHELLQRQARAASCQGMDQDHPDSSVVWADALLVSARLRPRPGGNYANDFTLTGSQYIVEIPSATCDGLGSACDWPEPPDPPPPSPLAPPVIPPYPPGSAPTPPPPSPHFPDAEFLQIFAMADALPEVYQRRYVRAMQIMSSLLGIHTVNRVLHAILIDPPVEGTEILDDAEGGHSAVFDLLNPYGYDSQPLHGCCLCGVSGGKGRHGERGMHLCVLSKAFMDNPHNYDPPEPKQYYYTIGHEYLHAWQREVFATQRGQDPDFGSLNMGFQSPNWWREGLANVFGYSVLQDYYNDFLPEENKAEQPSWTYHPLYKDNDSGAVAVYTDDDTGLPWGDMDERVEVGGAPAPAYDAYAAWALLEYGYRKVMVDLPLAMWAEPPLHKAYHDGWKTPFEEVIGVTPAASYAAFNTWAKNPSNPERFLPPRWYEELKLGDVLLQAAPPPSTPALPPSPPPPSASPSPPPSASPSPPPLYPPAVPEDHPQLPPPPPTKPSPSPPASLSPPPSPPASLSPSPPASLSPPPSPPADDEENAASASGPTSWVAVMLAAVASLAVWNKK